MGRLYIDPEWVGYIARPSWSGNGVMPFNARRATTPLPCDVNSRYNQDLITRNSFGYLKHGVRFGHEKIGKGSAKAGAQKAPHAFENSPPQEIVSYESP